MNIVIIGASGMLGNVVTKRCKANRYNVIEHTSKTINLYDKKNIENIFKPIKNIDFIINCAAYTNVDLAETESKKATNLNGTAVGTLATIAKQKNATFIHISSDYVFDGSTKKPYTESDTCNPINAYGTSKLFGETLSKQQCQQHYILRTQWLYGKNGQHFVKTMQQLMQSKTELAVVNDQIGSLTSVESLSAYIINFIQKKPLYGIYHCSDKGYASWYDIACKIGSIIGYNGLIKPVNSHEFTRPAARPLNSQLDCSKFDNAIGNVRAHWEDQLETYLLANTEVYT